MNTKNVINHLKSNYTKDEIVNMDKKEIKKMAKTKGFAIGTILLAIALIAAIGAAIAVASKSGGQDSASQTAKLAASNIVNMGSSIKTTVDKFRIQGTDIGKIIFDPRADGTATIDASYSGYYGIFNPTNGINFTQLPASALGGTIPSIPTCIGTDATLATDKCNRGTAAGYANWVINYSTPNIVNGFLSSAGTANSDVALMLKGVTAEACLEINKQVNETTGMTISGATTKIPETITTDYIGTGSTTLVGVADLDAGFGGNVQISQWSEGCLKNGALGEYYYFNLLKTN